MVLQLRLFFSKLMSHFFSHPYFKRIEQKDMLPCLQATGADEQLVQKLLDSIKACEWKEKKKLPGKPDDRFLTHFVQYPRPHFATV